MNDFVVKDSGKRMDYPSGMRRDTQEGKTNFRLIDLRFLRRLADHLTKGAEKYGRDNWRKANSVEELDRFKDSGLRHFMQWLEGEKDEDHAMAAVFNIMAAEHVQAKLDEQEKKEIEQREKNRGRDNFWVDWLLNAKPLNEPQSPVYYRVEHESMVKGDLKYDLFDMALTIHDKVVGKPLVTIDITTDYVRFVLLWKDNYKFTYSVTYETLDQYAFATQALAGDIVRKVNRSYLERKVLTLMK